MLRIPGSKTIFCKTAVFMSATSGSRRATHVDHRLLKGVFTREAIMTCTIKGQKPRHKKNPSQTEEVGTLHPTAIAAIIRMFFF